MSLSFSLSPSLSIHIYIYIFPHSSHFLTYYSIYTLYFIYCPWGQEHLFCLCCSYHSCYIICLWQTVIGLNWKTLNWIELKKLPLTLDRPSRNFLSLLTPGPHLLGPCAAWSLLLQWSFVSLPEVLPFSPTTFLCVYALLLPFRPWASWSSRGEMCIPGFWNSRFSTCYSYFIYEKGWFERDLKKQDFAIPVSTDNEGENRGPPSIYVLGIIYCWSCWIEGPSCVVMFSSQSRLGRGCQGATATRAGMWGHQEPTSWQRDSPHWPSFSTTSPDTALQSATLIIWWHTKQFWCKVELTEQQRESSASRWAAWGIHSRWLQPLPPSRQSKAALTNRKQVSLPGWETQGWQGVSRTNLAGQVDIACLFCFDIYPSCSCSSSTMLPCLHPGLHRLGCCNSCMMFSRLAPTIHLVHNWPNDLQNSYQWSCYLPHQTLPWLPFC